MNNDINIFNRKLVKQRRNKAAKNLPRHDFIIHLAANYMLESLQSDKQYKNILDLGCHSGQLGLKLAQQFDASEIVYCDFSEKMVANAGKIKIVADEELLPFALKSFDLIASCMSLHTVNDLPGTLIQIRHALKSGGTFIATMPGLATLQELRHVLIESEIEEKEGISPRIHPFSDVKTLGHLLQRTGFKQPVASSDTVQVAYKDVMSLLRDIKSMGEANSLINQGGYLSRNVLSRAVPKYQNLYGDESGGILATIEIITITGLAG